MSTIKVTEKDNRGRLLLFREENEVAQMTYSRFDTNQIIIDHTEVYPAFEGTGAGKEMVAKMVEWARENQQRVVPLCPFAKAMIERNQEYQDILKK